MNKVILILITIVVGIFFTDCNNGNSVKKTEGKEVINSFVSGSVKVERDFKIIDDKRVAVYEREYYEDGKLLKEGSLDKDEKRDGLWKSYYRDGVLWSEGDFVNGIRNGKTVTYFANGQKYYEGKFVKAKKSGVWKFWNEQGVLVNEVDYDKRKK